MRRGLIRFTTVLCFVTSLLASGCGKSPTSPTTDAASSGPELAFSATSAVAEVEYVPGDGPSAPPIRTILYGWCYSIVAPDLQTGESITIQRVETTVIGPNGDIYNQSTTSTLTGKRYASGGSFGSLGCPTAFTERNMARPVATRIKVFMDYEASTPSSRVTRSVEQNVAITSRLSPLPTTPQMTGMTLSNDLADGRTVRTRTPVTFTASGAGGVPPYEFEWRINNILVRDWRPEATLTWDLTLRGDSVFQGGYIVKVSGRSSGGRDVESSATTNLIVLAPQ